MDTLLSTFLNFDIMMQAAPILWAGLRQTMLLSLVAVPLGIIGGFVLAELSLSKRRAVGWLAAWWVDIFRALPPLVILIFLYAGLPFAGYEISAWGAVAVGFFLNTSSYYGEILRAGLESVPKGQSEAAQSTGMKRSQIMLCIVYPQAIRNMLPDLVSNTLEVVKLTSIASVVALPELLFQARQAQSVTFNASPIVAAALIYFILLWPAVRLLSRLENQMVASR